MSVTTSFISNTPKPATQTDVGINISKPGYNALSTSGSNLIYSSSWPTLQYPFELSYTGENVMPNTPYKFFAYPSGNQTATNAYSIMQVNTVVFDTGGNFNTSSYEFISPASGYYLFRGNALYQSVPDGGYTNIGIFVNGVEASRGNESTSGALENVTKEATYFTHLNIGDTVSLQIWGPSGSATMLGNDSAISSFGGFLVSS